LPQPRIAYFNKLKAQAGEDEPHTRPSQAAITPPSGTSPRETNSSRPRRMRQDSLGDPESDPWASSALTNPLVHPPPSSAVKANGSTENGQPASARDMSQRTTSAFTTHGEPRSNGSNAASGESQSTGEGAEWNAYNGGSAGAFSQQPPLGGGFGDAGDAGDEQGSRGSGNPPRSTGPSVVLSQGTGEVVTVSMLPEKEGMFMFQHRNYEVKSIRRGSSVVRRYSDFVWLLDCLHKRYPFRRIPLLPPKRVSGECDHELHQHSS
jgi:sorting nexin-8